MTPPTPRPHDLSALASPSSGLSPTARCWDAVIDRIRDSIRLHGVTAQRTVVLVPFAQLMAQARRSWMLSQPTGFPPRFETTRNWAAALMPWRAGPHDLSNDTARDSLIAAALLDRVARGRLDAALRREMIARLVEAARQLAPLAAAHDPRHRLAWAEERADALNLTSPALHWESMTARLALTWAATSAYATDALWTAQAEPGRDADLLLLLPGHQIDPLAEALMARWGDRAAVLTWPDTEPAEPRLQACTDAEDEAQWATSSVIEHLNAGRSPVALVALDRLTTRRVSALLQGAGAVVRDETGWKLSTTQAAASLMALLRAADARADTDAVLDLLKHAPAWSPASVGALEQGLRSAGISTWRSALRMERIAPLLPAGLDGILAGLQPARPLVQWLRDMARSLDATGQWSVLQADPAGQQALAALRLGDAAHELEALGRVGADDARPEARLTLSGFTAWVRDVLEGASFMPPSSAEPQVVVVPLAQLLGRDVAAVVAPGCDDMHLPASVEPSGSWTSAQREVLGLPSREALTAASQAAWRVLRGTPVHDLLWRTQERGEALAASPWVPLSGSARPAPARAVASLLPVPTARPAAVAADLLPSSLSASAYADLRACPYRFFATRQLQLSEAPELQEEPDQRDMGNWLHEVLKCFHESRGDARPGEAADRAELDRWAHEVAVRMGVDSEEGAAGFLPYRAQWPALRDGYLRWLAEHEAGGPRFWQAEQPHRAAAGRWNLHGTLDRIDVQASPEGELPFVIDYKTESRTRTRERLKMPLEDTQLAFYAALMPGQTLRAAYLSITDSRDPAEPATALIEHKDVLTARDALVQGLIHDLDRVAAGLPMAALGEGQACDFCPTRGLCRRDFWS